MSVPGIVDASLDGEEIAARVSLGSDDELFITPTRTIVYRSDGLLSDESADEFPHDADRLTISEGRRKTTFTLEYALDGEREFSVPASKTDAVRHPVLAGVLNGNGITDPGETVVKTYRFSELTLIITSDRLVKHIGGAVWDGDYEEYRFDDVTNLTFEDGSVATQIVLTVDGRPQRIKAPNEDANDLRERLQRALFEYHDVESLEEFNLTVGDDESEADGDDGSMDFGGGVDPLDADPPEPDDHEGAVATDDGGQSAPADPLADGTVADSGSTDTEPASAASAGDSTATQSSVRGGTTDDRADTGSSEPTRAETGSVFESATERTSAEGNEGAAAAGTDSGGTATGTDPELLERIEALEDAVERQNEVIERQAETIEQLIAELRQGR